MVNKAVFLDRDGVINKDYVDYVWTPEKFEILPGVVEAFQILRDAGYLLIVITNSIVDESYDASQVNAISAVFFGLVLAVIIEARRKRARDAGSFMALAK